MIKRQLSHLDGVILAAGFSSRAGTFKMELDFHGKSLLQNTIEAMSAVCSRIIVVGGFQIERIRKMTENYKNVRVVNNGNYESGMFSSVKTGVKEVSSQWFFYTPGDYPLVNEAIYQKLLEAEEESSNPEDYIFIPSFNGRKGHPALVKGSLKEELLAEPEDSNLKVFINRTGFVRVEVDDDSILKDVDTFEDYKRAVGKVDK